MSERLAIGSEEHKRRFCRMLIDTHDPFDPDRIAWPRLEAEERRRIAALPFWSDAIADEGNAMRRLEHLAARQSDPLLAEALALQGYEEGRHGRIIAAMLAHYAIAAAPPPPVRPRANPEFAYIRLGYGECFDSFFAFGMFHLAGRAGFFPAPLVALFEPIVQEEARHILFFQNWVAYVRANRPAAHRALHRLTCARALAQSVGSRLRIAAALRHGAGARGGGPTFPVDRFSLKGFLGCCVAEHARRLEPYDPGLLRPRLIPSLAAALLKALPGGGADRPGAMGRHTA
jgi:hypothetical protein